ncbi:MAG: hypothetical protein IJK44_10900 [Bacteroidales bacterium]|nr:hypothetical protein [Bacteroidales bacterium]
MKKIAYIIIVVAALASCSRKVEFTRLQFVYFSTPAVSVYEDAALVKIPVKAVSDVDFTVTFETIDGEKLDATTGQTVPNGKKGEDYSIVDNEAAILRFKAGQQSDTIQVKITDFPGVLTGNKEFSVKLLGVSGGEVSLGGFSTCKVTIIDNDHPLKEIFGEYAATDGDSNAWTVTLAEDPTSYTNVLFDGIVPFFAGTIAAGTRYYVVAPVSEDLSTISIPLGYKLADQWDGYDILIFGYDGQYIYNSGMLSFMKTDTGYKLEGSQGFAAIYENGGYYIPGSDALATSPITLVKK